MKKILDYRYCFVCGKDSDIGLKLDFEPTETGARTSYTPGEEFQGFQGVVHGGIVCALLDEVMWKAINGQTGAVTMTAKMDVKFKKPVPVGTRLLVEGSVTGRKRNVYEAESTVCDAEGKILAQATGLFIEIGEDKKAALMETLS